MSDIDVHKIHLIDQAIGWLQNAKKYHAAYQHQVADDCLIKAKRVLDDESFKRQPIPGFSRNQQPETLWVRNPVTNGKMLINSVDFDPNVHEVWEEATPAASGKRSKST
jgi:hypothetical protein